MATYRKFKVTEVGTDTYIDHELNYQRVPCACAFHPHYDLCAISYDNGHIRLYSTFNDTLKLVKEFACHCQCIFAIAWINDRLLCATSGDQTTLIYDIETGDEIDLLRGHTMSVRSVCKLKSSPYVLATGGRDSIVNIYDRRYSKKQGALHPISSIACAHISSTALQKSARKDTRSVTAVEFQDEHNLYSCACADSAIKVWDLRYTYSRLNTTHMPKPKRMFCVPINDVKSINRLVGFSDMKMDTHRSILFANCTNSKIYQFDLNEMSSAHHIRSYTSHRVGSFNVKIALSPHDQLLLTGSSDFSSYIYRVNQPTIEPLKIEHHFEEVTAVAYHPSNPFSFVTCSDDFQVRLWSLTFENETSISSGGQSHNLVSLLRHRQYGLIDRHSLLSSLFHTCSSSSSSRYPSFIHNRRPLVSSSILHRPKKTAGGGGGGRKRTVSENDENRRDTNDQTCKRLCCSSEWIFGDSQSTLLKSISTMDNRTSIDKQQQQQICSLSKSDGFLSKTNHHNRRYSSDKQQQQQTMDTLSTLVLSQ